MRGQAGKVYIKKCGLLSSGPLGEGAGRRDMCVKECGLLSTGPLS